MEVLEDVMSEIVLVAYDWDTDHNPTHNPGSDAIRMSITSLPLKGTLYADSDGLRQLTSVPWALEGVSRSVWFVGAADSFSAPGVVYTEFSFSSADQEDQADEDGVVEVHVT